jgi:hypothetical protein
MLTCPHLRLTHIAFSEPLALAVIRYPIGAVRLPASAFAACFAAFSILLPVKIVALSVLWHVYAHDMRPLGELRYREWVISLKVSVTKPCQLPPWRARIKHS